MALFKRAQEEKPKAITAAAAQVDLAKPASLRYVKARAEKWQEEAWSNYKTIGEIKYGMQLLGNYLSRVRLVAAEKDTDDPDADPVPTKNEQAIDALKRIEGPAGGHGEHLKSGTVNLMVAGECYLVCLHERGDEPEKWAIRSIDELIKKGGGNRLILKDQATGRTMRDKTEIELDAKDFVMRIWYPDERFHADADSPMGSISAVCEELLILQQSMRAVGRSRSAGAGILVLPNDISFGSPDPTRNSDEADDPFMEELIAALTTPIQNEGSADAVVPLIVRGDGEHLDKIKHISFMREADKAILDRMNHLLERIAHGLPLPPELILGLGASNHWTAWAIDESMSKAHVEPPVITLCGALTSGYFRPALTAGSDGMSPEDASRFLVWYDASPIVVRPNRAAEAGEAHDRIAISDDAYRKYLNFDDEDAPDEEERQERIAVKRGSIDPVLTEQLLILAGILNARPIETTAEPAQLPAKEPEEEQPEDGPPEEPEPPQESVAASSNGHLTAALSRKSNLGERLSAIDRVLRERLDVALDATMQRALERAGSRLRSKARKDQAMTAAIRNAPHEEVASILGPAFVKQLGLTEDELVEGSLESMQGQFDRMTRNAQDAALDEIPGLTEREREELRSVQDDDRAEAWGWLLAALMASARFRLYEPRPTPPEVGEWSDALVDFSVTREAVARAGGSIGVVVSGIGTGPVVTDMLGRKGHRIEGYRWNYGVFPRARPFEPHRALDGMFFSDFSDETLLNFSSFPGGSHYAPGDHKGCRCDYDLDVTERESEPIAASASKLGG
jgi:hypothetical protein